MVKAKVINSELGTFNEILNFCVILTDMGLTYEDIETGEYYYRQDIEII